MAVQFTSCSLICPCVFVSIYVSVCLCDYVNFIYVTHTIPSPPPSTAMINILNTILGSGMLAMPSAIASVGFVPGALVICLFGYASFFGLHLLAKCAVYTGRHSSFNAISRLTYPNAAIFFDFAIAIKCFGVAVSYLIIVGDLMPQAMLNMFDIDESHLFANRRFWISCCMAIVVPFSFLRRLDSLKYTSFIALTAIVYIFMLVIFFFFDSARISQGETHVFEPHWSFFARLPIFVFAFTCHQNLFSVYNELKDNSQKRINLVTGLSEGISTVIYLTVGLLGYAMYGDEAKSNILLNSKWRGMELSLMIDISHPTCVCSDQIVPSSILVTIARLLMTMLVVFSYALQCHPSRASFDKVIGQLGELMAARRRNGIGYQEIGGTIPEVAGKTVPVKVDEQQQQHNQEDVDVEQEEQRLLPSGRERHRRGSEMSTSRYVGITLAILSTSYVIAFFLSNLGKVLSLVGATGSTTICYILPGIFYLKLKENDPWSSPHKVGALLMLIAGLIIMPVCVTFVFVDL